MAEYQKDNIKFISKGLNTSIVRDILPEGFFPFLENTRITEEGAIRSRPKIDIIGNLNPVVADLAHSIRKLVDKSSSLTSYVIGAGTKLYSGSLSVPNLIESGFSGEPLSIVEFRPEESVAAYLYIADRLKFRRIGVDNISSEVGITPPLVPVNIEVDKPERKVIDELGAGTLASWVNGGSAGAPAIQNRINTTITGIVLDGALPNFCSIVPTNFQAALQIGTQLNLGGTEAVFVEQVHKGLINSGVCNIQSIKYTSGVTGECIIDLSIPIDGLEVGSILYINSTEYVRVLDVIKGSNGTVSIKVNSVGTFAVSNTIVGVSSFRTYITINHLAGEAITTDAIKTTIGASGLSTLTRTTNFDLSTTSARGLNSKDFFHASVLATDASQIEEIQIQLDIDASINDFLHNWYSYAIRANDLLPSSELTSPSLAIQQQVINRAEVQTRFYRQENYGYEGLEPRYQLEPVDNFSTYEFVNTPVINDGQLNVGDAQWTEVLIPFEKFQKNGSDSSRGFKDVKAIRISIKTKGITDVYIDSLWVGGGYDLDSNVNNNIVPYRYMARYRESKTKTISNWSPINREGVSSFRNRHLLSVPVSPDSRVDRIDFARIGGANTDFRILGTKLNDTSKFVDDISDFAIRDNPRALRITTSDNIGDRDYFKPFALLDIPRKGTCNVVGNILTVISGDNLNTSYALGTRVLINNIVNRFYTQPKSPTEVELEDNVGTLLNVPFEIKEPLLTGQPLPILAGPIGKGNSGLIIFGAGDKNAAGTVYWLDGNSADTMSDTNRLEVSPPSEPIVGLCMYDNYIFVWTTKHSYLLTPSITENGILQFRADENANSVGLAHKNLLTVANDAIYYLRHDLTGIDKVQGNGNPISITDSFIANLFVSSGKLPTSYSPHIDAIIHPPDFTRVTEQRLITAGDFIFYSYYNILGTPECLVYDIKGARWISRDSYPNNAIGDFFGEDAEGDYRILIGVNGQIGAFLDTGSYETINSKLLVGERNQGDFRINKEYHELVLDLLPGSISENVHIKLGFNDNIEYLDLGNRGGYGLNQRRLELYEINGFEGIEARNISALLTWNPSTTIRLYGLQYNFIPKPESISTRPKDIDGGYEGNKFIQAITIRTNTNGIDKAIDIYDEFGVKKDTIIINHDGECIKTYAFQTPFISHFITLVPFDSTKLINDLITNLVFDKEPEFAKIWEGQPNNYGTPNLKQAKLLHITHRSTSDITLKLSYDNKIDDEYIIRHSNGLRIEESIFLRPNKWKQLRPRLESLADFQLYRNGCKLFLIDLTMPNDYITPNPFGDDSNITDVRA